SPIRTTPSPRWLAVPDDDGLRSLNLLLGGTAEEWLRLSKQISDSDPHADFLREWYRVLSLQAGGEHASAIPRLVWLLRRTPSGSDVRARLRLGLSNCLTRIG